MQSKKPYTIIFKFDDSMLDHHNGGRWYFMTMLEGYSAPWFHLSHAYASNETIVKCCFRGIESGPADEIPFLAPCRPSLKYLIQYNFERAKLTVGGDAHHHCHRWPHDLNIVHFADFVRDLNVRSQEIVFAEISEPLFCCTIRPLSRRRHIRTFPKVTQRRRPKSSPLNRPRRKDIAKLRSLPPRGA